jgi:hypothetical protein
MSTPVVSLFEKIRKGEQGMFDPTKRYAFTNITDEPFQFGWNGVNIDVAPKETVEIPQYLAYQAVNKMIDQLIIAKNKKDLDKIRETHPEYLTPPGAGMMGIPAYRVTFESMIVRELPPKVGADAKLDIIRAKEQVMSDIRRSQVETAPIESIKVAQTEFAELKEMAPAQIV